jgi:hypothetical protein
MPQSANRIYIQIELKAIMKFRRMAPQRRKELFGTAAERYKQYLRKRYISNSSGKGGWAELKKSTKQRKKRRGIATNPNWILRESNTLLNSMDYQLNPKGFEIGYLGIKSQDIHPTNDYTAAPITVGGLAEVHHFGLGRQIARPIIVEPDSRHYKLIIEAVQKEFNKLIREVNI